MPQSGVLLDRSLLWCFMIERAYALAAEKPRPVDLNLGTLYTMPPESVAGSDFPLVAAARLVHAC